MDAETVLPPPEPRWALFLDVDGTLVEIAPTPDAVRVGRRLVDLLSSLTEALGGAVALVSGRPIHTLDSLFAPLVLPAGGNHGLERRDSSGALTTADVQPAVLDPVRAAFAAFAGGHPGVVVEDKLRSVALHYRQHPEAAADAERLAEDAVRGLGGGFRLQRGKMLIEVRPRGADKGTIIETFMTEPPFAGRVPVFVGDDATDEDGFAAVNRLGGHSIRVGAAEGSAARWRVASIDALLDWLATIVAALPAEV